MAVDFARETALKILYEINEKGAYSNVSINKHLSRNSELKNIDKAFVTELVYGTVKWKLKLDYIISKFSNLKLNKISPWILNVLRLGVYQLIYMDRVPDSAACNESVKLAKKYGHGASGGFVNGVLRSVSRNKNNIVYPDRESNLVRYLSIMYSHPEWMVENFLSRYGEKFTESLLKSNNETPDITIRVNTCKITKEEILKEFYKEGISAREGNYAHEAIILNNPSSITEIEAFKQGYFQVQDESSMLVGYILDPKPGETVIDVCSAPGGKATHIAQLMKNTGLVLARDIHPHKIKLIDEAALRLSFDIIKTQLFDATKLDTDLVEKADGVLVDAPCTGLGIIRKKPDIKWARNTNDLEEIKKLQGTILETASKYVKPGGKLVYSTCTIQKEENEDIVESFLNKNPDFEPVDITDCLPGNLVKETSKNGYIQLYPNIDKTDGFFISKMVKRS